MQRAIYSGSTVSLLKLPPTNSGKEFDEMLMPKLRPSDDQDGPESECYVTLTVVHSIHQFDFETKSACCCIPALLKQKAKRFSPL